MRPLRRVYYALLQINGPSRMVNGPNSEMKNSDGKFHMLAFIQLTISLAKCSLSLSLFFAFPRNVEVLDV